MTNENRKVLVDAIIKYGVDHQKTVAIEELSELTKEITKSQRSDTEVDIDHLIEEVADVYIVLHEIMIMFCISEDVGKWIDVKVKRLRERMREE